MTGLVASTEADWHAFSALERMMSHWDRAGWWPGRSGYYWYLTFEDASPLRSLATRCQQVFAEHVGFDLVPTNDLHMTLDRIGFEDEVTKSQLSLISRGVELAASQWAPLTITVGPLAGSSGALSFSASPKDSINTLRLELSRVSQQFSEAVLSEPAFRPHIGIAYCNSSLPAGPIIETVSQLRQIAPIQVPVTQVSLVRLTRLERAYRWSVHQRVRLGGSGRVEPVGRSPRWR